MKQENYVTYSELSEMFDDMLNESWGIVEICGYYYYDTARALQLVDPIAYREELLNYIDRMCRDEELEEYEGNYYWKKEV